MTNNDRGRQKDSEYQSLLDTCRNSLERFVYYKVNNKTDGDDILQEVYLAAFKKIDTLKDKDKFKSWIFAIARNKINDFLRSRAMALEIPLDENISYIETFTRIGLSVDEVIDETLSELADKEKQILYLYFIRQKQQSDIARMLNIPLGTVKSRLHTAKLKFKERYPYKPKSKGVFNMSKLPDILPEIKIDKIDKPVFDVVWEECIGWFIIPRPGEKCRWAIYDYPQRTRSETCDMEVTGKTSVHGIEGVEIVSRESNTKPFNSIGSASKADRTFVVQLTDTHSRILAESHYVGDVKHIYTFYDEEFLKNWGYGNDNCGKETHVKPKGLVVIEGDRIICKECNALDVVGRYRVSIGGKSYDCILAVGIEDNNGGASHSGGIMTYTYLDKNGKTVLWRRFNKDDWAFGRYKQKWSDKLPDNEKVYVNGETYVHWYDCITDYVV